MELDFRSMVRLDLSFIPNMQMLEVDYNSQVEIDYIFISPTCHNIHYLCIRWGESTTVACYWGSRASPKRCTIAWAWRTPPKSRPTIV
ncbi:hypothetical protein ACB092_02G012500 [Castanea dentata]